MKALERFCKANDLILDTVKNTIDGRKFYSKSLINGGKRYYWEDNGKDLMKTFYSSRIGMNRTEYRESNVLCYYNIGNRRS